MTDRQKYAIKLAINTMGIHLDSHCNTAYVNRKTGVSVGYGEAINILSDMLSNADNHTCSCQYNSNSRDNEPCCRCDSRKTNADRVRNMSDEEMASVLFSGCIDSMDLEECPYASESELDNNKIRKICKKCVLEWLQSEAE